MSASRYMSFCKDHLVSIVEELEAQLFCVARKLLGRKLPPRETLYALDAGMGVSSSSSRAGPDL